MVNNGISIYRISQKGLFLLLIITAFVLNTTIGFAGLYNKKASPEMDEVAKSFKPEVGKAVIYIYRQSSLVAFIQAFRIYLNDHPIANCTSGAFIRLVVGPGTHRIGVGNVSSSSLRDSLAVATEEGKIYYIELEIKANILSGVPKLNFVEMQKAQKEIKTCSLIEL
jgi:hypothetical protein